MNKNIFKIDNQKNNLIKKNKTHYLHYLKDNSILAYY